MYPSKAISIRHIRRMCFQFLRLFVDFWIVYERPEIVAFRLDILFGMQMQQFSSGPPLKYRRSSSFSWNEEEEFLDFLAFWKWPFLWFEYNRSYNRVSTVCQKGQCNHIDGERLLWLPTNKIYLSVIWMAFSMVKVSDCHDDIRCTLIFTRHCRSLYCLPNIKSTNS